MNRIESKKTISILGCGWFGRALAAKLNEEGFGVKGSSTTEASAESIRQSGAAHFIVNFLEDAEEYDDAFFHCDVLVVSIPPKRSAAAQHTFLAKIKRIAHAATANQVKQVLFISSTSVYGEANSELTEARHPLPDTASGKAILDAEEHLKAQKAFSTTIVRFGGLVGPGRDPGRFFAGKKDIPNGNAPVNLIHLTDAVGLVMRIFERAAFGNIYNACAADHPSRKEFYTRASQLSGLEIPHFIDELLQWKLVNSLHVPRYLAYTFQTKF